MKVYEIAEKIEEKAPRSLAYDWDNPGILLGDANAEVSKVVTALDVDSYAVQTALQNGANMIVSHHPMFFKGIKKINTASGQGELIKILIKNDIAVFAAHTNLDIAPGGINDRLAEMLGLSDTDILEATENGFGLGRVGYPHEEMSFSKFCEFVSEALDTPLRAAGDFGKAVKKVAVGSGSCSEVIGTAVKKGCDVIVTGDMKYHETMDAVAAGINVIDAGHYPTEKCAVGIFREILSGCGIEITESPGRDVFSFIFGKK